MLHNTTLQITVTPDNHSNKEYKTYILPTYTVYTTHHLPELITPVACIATDGKAHNTSQLDSACIFHFSKP